MNFYGITFSKNTNIFLTCIAILRLLLYFLETDVFKTKDTLDSPLFFLWAERIITLIFIIEYVVRIKKAKNIEYYKYSRWNYLKSFFGIVDLLSFIFSLIGFFVTKEMLGAIRALRIICLLKIFRLSTYFKNIIDELRKLMPMIIVVFTFSSIICIIAGSLMFEIEKYAQPDKFTGIFDGIWWACVTMTTIGYGDLYPISNIGRTLAVITMIMGIGMIGSYIGIFGIACSKVFKKLIE